MLARRKLANRSTTLFGELFERRIAMSSVAESVLDTTNVLLLVCVNRSEAAPSLDGVALEFGDPSRKGRGLVMDFDGLLIEF
jgi:hypothetical protein